MIGLTVLAVGLLWFGLSLFIAIKLPRCIGIKREEFRWLLTGFLLLVFMIGPFVDHIIGMRQFEKLCDIRTVIQVDGNAHQVKRAKQVSSPTTELQGYWIKIRSTPVVYIDTDTSREFLRYEILNTNGGLLGGLIRVGNSYQCLPKDYSLTKRLNIDQLLELGK